MLQKDFNPVLRFMVVSDVHYKDDHCIEEERMEKAIKIAKEALDRADEAYAKAQEAYREAEDAYSEARSAYSEATRN